MAASKKNDLMEIIHGICPDVTFEDVNANSLSSPKVLGTSSNFVYLILEISQRWNIKFDAEDFTDYKLNSFKNVVNLIEAKTKG